MMEHIGTTFRSIPFDGVANDLTFAGTSTGPIIVPGPTPIEIPGHLQSDLRISDMYIGEGQPGDIVSKVSVRSQPNLTGVSASSRVVLFRHAHGPTFLDCEGIALFDSAQEIFANHSLDLLPIVRADSIAGLQINFGGNRRSKKTEERKDQCALGE